MEYSCYRITADSEHTLRWKGLTNKSFREFSLLLVLNNLKISPWHQLI